MSIDVTLSPEARVDINGLPYGTISGNVRVTRDLVPRTSTEDSAYRTKASPFRRLQLQAMAQRDPDAAYHAAPLDLWSPDGIWVRIWFRGRSDPLSVLDIPTLILSEEAYNWNMANSSAQEINITGEADDEFALANGE